MISEVLDEQRNDGNVEEEMIVKDLNHRSLAFGEVSEQSESNERSSGG